ncbi:MAG TPA: hypothetical protein DC046_15375, partial [Rhodospirillaceae bacterium]|nr:hypothetical protein [Rhodospirillaceae bacterium]
MLRDRLFLALGGDVAGGEFIERNGLDALAGAQALDTLDDDQIVGVQRPVDQDAAAVAADDFDEDLFRRLGLAVLLGDPP